MAEKFSGRLPPEEDKVLSAWISRSADHQRSFQVLKKVWDKTPAKRNHPDADSENEWRRLEKRIQRNVRVINTVRWVAVAASLAILIAAGIFVFQKPRADETMTSLRSGDEVASFYLPDSTRVWLNTNSVLRFGQGFGSEDRRVTLRGEVFFAVRHNTIPFFVETPFAAIRVVGTSFNVRTLDTAAVISVERGKVVVESSRTVTELGRAETVMVSEHAVIRRSNVGDVASWRGLDESRQHEEEQFPRRFLVIRNSQRKNKLAQTMVEGYIENKASSAVYRDIVLKVTYERPNGRASVSLVPIQGVLHPGEKIRFLKKLPDLFSGRKRINVEVETVAVDPLP